MPAFDFFLSVSSAVLSLAIVAGLIHRRRIRALAAFPAYLLLGILARVAHWLWPAELYNWRYDVATDLLQGALGIAIAVELVHRAFGALPGGRARAQRLQAVVAASALLGLLAPWPALETLPPFYVWGVELVQRLAYMRAWLFAACLAVSSWYAVPLDRIHRDVAGAFVVWSLVMALGQHLGQLDGTLQLCRQVVASLIYPGVLAAWALMAWAPDEQTEFRPDVLAVLRPWRARAS